ncbi:aminotransferase class I/II-fold pyridoxal phosphate-dependent enzyme [Methylomonas sp. AM2-LC]|uniref:aminotransferase class I/II-fold pyridoxal phosphate-dependent enzyme n=1 Tax=Methylomonas sp. AM2-LC TaxID=3153301 RepID=UPI00326730C1
MNQDSRALARQLLSSGAAKPEGAKVGSIVNPVAAKIIHHQARGFDNHPGALEFLKMKENFENMGINGNSYFQAWTKRDGAKVLIGDAWKINYSSYNYLGLATDPEVMQAAKDAIDQYGTSVSAARMVAGQIPLHDELEAEFAAFFGTEDALLFVSGFLTNVATLGFLLTDKDLIIHDELIHNSMVTGALLSGARRLTFPHNDAQGLDRLLKMHRHLYERAIILTEGVFSMDGDLANIRPIIEVAHRHDASIMLDEAHSMGTIGATGRGVQEALGVKSNEIEIWMGSLSKSVGSAGGFIAGSKNMINNLRYNAPGAVLYCAGMPAPTAAAALCGLRKLKKEIWRVEKLQANAAYFLKKAQEYGLDTGISTGTAVVPVIIGDSEKAVKLANLLNTKNINVHAIIYPAVPLNQARLRFFINCTHTFEEIDYTIATVSENLNKV